MNTHIYDRTTKVVKFLHSKYIDSDWKDDDDDVNNAVGIVFDEKLESIDFYAFSYMAFLVVVTLPNSVKAVAEHCFDGCTGLKSVTLSDSMERIYKGTFYNCSSLEHVYIGKETRHIESQAFWDCKNLKTISFPEKLASIGAWAFALTGLEKVTLPEGIEAIEEKCFLGCRNLHDVKIPESVTLIQYLAFFECLELKNVFIPNNMRVIEEKAFQGSGLEHISLPRDVYMQDHKPFLFPYTVEDFTCHYNVKSLELRELEINKYCVPNTCTVYLCMIKFMSANLPVVNTHIINMIIHMYIKETCQILPVPEWAEEISQQCEFKYFFGKNTPYLK